MKIKHLQLKNYRNYKKLDLELDSGLNIFIGNNAQGKSNILESIFVLALTKSYINVKDQYLINIESDFALLKAEFVNGTVENKLEVIITENSKKLKINGDEVKKYCDYISKVKVLIFSPYNVNFVKDGPNTRRKCLNMVIGQISNNYIKVLQNYNAVLKKRNQFLKSIDCFKEYNRFYFDALNERFCVLAVEVILERNRFIIEINKFLSFIYEEITDYKDLYLKYSCNVEICEKKEIMLEKLKLKTISFFDREKACGMTLLGPHRDDFIFYLSGRELEVFGSQGQIKAAILALKLAELLTFKEKDGEYPILLLDDIFSELDVDKRNKLIKYILDDVQTIITTTDINLIDKSLIDKSKVFVVNNGEVVEDGKKECNYE